MRPVRSRHLCPGEARGDADPALVLHGLPQDIQRAADCLACGVSGTLEEMGEVAIRAEEDGPMAAVRFHFASHVDPLVPWRYVRRRRGWMEGLMRMLCGLLPLFFGMEPTLSALRARLGPRTALRDLRGHCADHLGSMPFPVGFRLPPRRW